MNAIGGCCKQRWHNRIPFRYVLNDLWFASAENMRFVKLDLDKEFIMAPQGQSQGGLVRGGQSRRSVSAD